MTVCLNHVFMLNIFFIKFFVDLFIFSPSQIVQLILQKSLLHRPLIMITGRITMKGYTSVLKPDPTLTIGAGHSSPPPLPVLVTEHAHNRAEKPLRQVGRPHNHVQTMK